MAVGRAEGVVAIDVRQPPSLLREARIVRFFACMEAIFQEQHVPSDSSAANASTAGADAILHLALEAALRKAEVRAAQAALAELEAWSRPEEIAQAAASVQKAQAWLNELLAGSRPEDVPVAQAAVHREKAEAFGDDSGWRNLP
jgi:hypothetical protein